MYVEACQVLGRIVPVSPPLGVMARAIPRSRRQIQEQEDKDILAVLSAAEEVSDS